MNINSDGAEIDAATDMEVYGDWIKFVDGEGATVKIDPYVVKQLMDFALANKVETSEPVAPIFANLIAAHKAEVITAEAYRCGYEAGAAAEREECAKLCEAGVNSDKYPSLTDCAAAIRAKSQT